MRLNTQGSQFVFNLPSDLVPKSIRDRYTPLLEKNWIQYENVIDYINSTIKEVSFPGLSIPLPEQVRHYGKIINYKPVQNINDIVTTRELSVVFRRVDSDLNYLLLYDLITNAYLNVREQYVKPFQVIALDIHRDAIYSMNFHQIILNAQSEIIFAYNQQSFEEQTFTMTFNYNFMDIDFLLNGEKILQLRPDELPTIIERGWFSGDEDDLNLDDEDDPDDPVNNV